MTWLRRQQRRQSGRTPQACKNQTNGHQPGLEGQVASMNDISISSISANLGLGGLLTDQTLTLATEYGLNFVAALITVIIGIWASRRLSGCCATGLPVGPDRPDAHAHPGGAGQICDPDADRRCDAGQFRRRDNLDHRRSRCRRPCHRPCLAGHIVKCRRRSDDPVPAPFKIGDWVEAAGVSGSVREIGLFTTTIDTFDNVYTSVPNSAIWTSTIINHARYGTRRMDLDIGISYDADLDEAEAALMELAADPRVLTDPEPRFLACLLR